jgi:hypothetical protein
MACHCDTPKKPINYQYLILIYISDFSHPDSSGPPEIFHTYFYNHAHRLHLKRLLSILEVPTDFFNHFWIQVAVLLPKPPNGSFRIETAKNLTAIYLTDITFLNGRKCPFGCNGYVTAVAACQSQRLYSGVRFFNFNWYYFSSPPQIPRFPRSHLESG